MIQPQDSQASHSGSRRPFLGLDVAEGARLRLTPGSVRCRFDNEVWDLTGLADAPVVMSAHRKILDFTIIDHPMWQLVAREYLFARLAPHLPEVATLPQAFRSPMNPNSLWLELKHLALWFNHLTAASISTLRHVTQAHCDEYLNRITHSDTDPSRKLAPASLVTPIRVCRNLALYGELLSDAYLPGFSPWAGRSTDAIAGHVRDVQNKTPAVPDNILQPLLANCLYLVQELGPHIAKEAQIARQNDKREAESRRALKLEQVPTLRRAIQQRHAAGIPAISCAPQVTTQRLNSGWTVDDPLLHLAFHPLVVQACGAMGHRRDLETLRPELEQWVKACGLECPYARDAAIIRRADDHTPIKWSEPMLRQQLDSCSQVVIAAAYFLTSALTGMRASELAELTAGCRTQEPIPAGIRYRLAARRIKGAPFGGTDEQWVVIKEVHDAVGLAETITGRSKGEPLFTNNSNNSASRVRKLCKWINGPAGQRLGLQPIPEGPINPRRLRQTLAKTIAQRPHGLMAARIHLKHVSVATTEGYVARPGGHQARFVADITKEEEAHHLDLTIAAYEEYKRGTLPTGQGARDLITAFRSVDAALATNGDVPARVIDDRRAERILKTKAATLHLGPSNYCWFTDPSKALCLRIAQQPDADQPLLGMCDSARCSQATHHPAHREAWSEHAQHTREVFLGNPRVSPIEQKRAEDVVARAERVIAEIDQAVRKGNSNDS